MADENNPDVAANLSPAAPQASPAEIKAAEAIASQLDPDLQSAILSGNSPVIQAVAAGATTNDQVARHLISMGVTTGLPPGVQAMVTEQQDKLAQARKDEELSAERRAAALAAVVGVGMMGGMMAADQGSGSSDGSGVKSRSEMSAMERNIYFSHLAAMSFDQYASLSDGTRQKHISNLSAEGQAQVAEGEKGLAEFPNRILSDPKYGATPEERQATLKQIEEGSSYDYNWDGFKKNLEGKSPEVQKAMLDRRELLYKANLGKDIEDAGHNAQTSHDEKDLHGEHKHVKSGSEDGVTLQEKLARTEQLRKEIEGNTVKYDAATKSGDVTARKSIALQNDESLSQLSEATKPVGQAFDKQDSLRTSVDAKAAQQVAMQKTDDYGDDAPAQVAAAAPRFTQDLTRLQLAGMLQPEGVELEKAAANDPSAPQITAKKPAGPASGGMSA